MVHTEAGAQARVREAGAQARVREPGTQAGVRAASQSGALSPVVDSDKDTKALPRRPPGSQAVAAFGDTVLQPWLRERKAQDLRGGQVPATALQSLVTQLLADPLPDDVEPVATAIRSLCRALPSPLAAPLLHAVLEAARAAALRAPDFASQCHVAYAVLQGIGDVSADDRGEQHLQRLLAAVLAFDEASPRPAILFASWLRLVVTHVSEEGLVPFVLRALEAHPPRSAPALADVAGHLALHALRELKERPDLVFLHLGQVLSWLLRQDGPRRAEGLGGLGNGLGCSKHLSPRLLCEVLQAIAAARDEIRERKAGADVRALMDSLASGAGWHGPPAQGVLQALASCTQAAADPLPRDEAVATARGLFDATLHPGPGAQALVDGLLPWQELLSLAVLAPGDVEHLGRSAGDNLGGPEMPAQVLSALVEGLASQAGTTAKAGAALRGIAQSAGGSLIDDAQLAAMASALARAPLRSGLPLALALVDTLGGLGEPRAQALPALRERLGRLLPPPLPATWRTALALASDPLGALMEEGFPPGERIAGLEAAYALPGLVDAAMVERQLWGCTLLAATDLPLALQAARQLLLQAGSHVTPAAFRELRAALLPQARQHQEALADLYACFARHGNLEEGAAPPSNRKAGAKAAARGGWQQRPSASHRRGEAAAAFLREEAALLGRGMARVAFEPLARSLEALAREMAPVTERKR